MDWYVTFFALVMGGICFLIYVGSAVATFLVGSHQVPGDVAGMAKSMATAAQPKASVEDYSKLLDAASKLTDSLSKAGPTLVSLVGAILFLLIAALSSGALKSPPPTVPPGAPTNTTAASPR